MWSVDFPCIDFLRLWFQRINLWKVLTCALTNLNKFGGPKWKAARETANGSVPKYELGTQICVASVCVFPVFLICNYCICKLFVQWRRPTSTPWRFSCLPCLNRPWICCLCQDLWNKARLQDPSRGLEGLQLLRSKLAGRTKELSPTARLRTTTICTRMMGIGPRYAAGGFWGTWNNLLQFRVIGISTPWARGKRSRGPLARSHLLLTWCLVLSLQPTCI